MTPRSRRAIIVLIALLAIAALTIVVLSSPAERHLYLAGELDRFTLSQTVELDISQASSVHLRNMDLRFTRAGASRDFEVKGARSQPAGSALLRARGRRGPLSITAPFGSVLDAPPGAIRFTPPDGRAVLVAMEADTIEIVELNRATGDSPPSVTNAEEMVRLDAECREECTFGLSDALFSALPDGQPLRLDTGRQVTLPDFRVKDAMLRKVKDADLNSSHAAELAILPGRDFSWTAIDIRPGGAISVAGRGMVSSLRQDGREILPNRWQDMLSADPATRGVYGGAVLLVVLAWGLLFKRALDILVKVVLPD